MNNTNIDIYPNLQMIPKVCYMYWDGNPLSFLNYLTIITFKKHNPDWKIKLYMPIIKTEAKTWKSNANKDKYIGIDYLDKVRGIPEVEIVKINFNNIGLDNNISEIIKSDYLRHYLLGNFGGMWSDMDIVYIKPITEMLTNTKNIFGDFNIIDTVVDYRTLSEYRIDFSVGLLMSSPDNPFYLNLIDECKRHYDPTDYQTFGSCLVMKLYNNVEAIKAKYPHLNILNMHHDTYLPIKWSEMSNIFTNIVPKITDRTIGIHWFNGSPISKKFQNDFSTLSHPTTGTIYKYIEEYIPLSIEYHQNNKV
jgi:hypothetical protein